MFLLCIAYNFKLNHQSPLQFIALKFIALKVIALKVIALGITAVKVTTLEVAILQEEYYSSMLNGEIEL